MKSKNSSTPGMKTVPCRECTEDMQIAQESTAGTCWRCVNKMMAGPAGRLEYAPDDVMMDSLDNTEDEDDGSVSVPDESWND